MHSAHRRPSALPVLCSSVAVAFQYSQAMNQAPLTITLGHRGGENIRATYNKAIKRSIDTLYLVSNYDRQHEESWYWLRQVQCLKKLVIEKDVIGDETAKELERLASSVKELVLQNCKFTLPSMLRLANGLAQSTSSCVTLVIRGCELDEKLVRSLVGGLQNNSVLEVLSLEANKIVDPTCLAIVLPTMTSLRYCSLNHNLLTNMGANALLEGLKKTPLLSKLKLQIQVPHSKRAKRADSRVIRGIYFYNRWNEIQGWNLFRASDGIWSRAIPRLAKKRWFDVIFHLLRSHPRICLREFQEKRPCKRASAGS